MEAAANGREVKVVSSDYGFCASIAMRKADGWWVTSMIPRYYNPLNSKDPEQKLLAFMGFLPQKSKVINADDAVEFVRLWVEEHRND